MDTIGAHEQNRVFAAAKAAHCQRMIKTYFPYRHAVSCETRRSDPAPLQQGHAGHFWRPGPRIWIAGHQYVTEGKSEVLRRQCVVLEIDIVGRPIGEDYRADQGRWPDRTLVMSVVAASISCSSNVRSVKPGRTCLACNFSRAVTVQG